MNFGKETIKTEGRKPLLDAFQLFGISNNNNNNNNNNNDNNNNNNNKQKLLQTKVPAMDGVFFSRYFRIKKDKLMLPRNYAIHRYTYLI
jgi:hypothetical protein